jgi:outer membrane protein insertion porin family
VGEALLRKTWAVFLLGGLLAIGAETAETAGTAGAQEPASAPETPPAVSAVEIRSETDLGDQLDELQGLLSFAPGSPLTDEAVARTLRNIQASGIASEAELYTRPDETGAGVVAILVLRPVVRVREVRLTGELGVRAGELRRELPQKEAEPLNEEKVVQGVYQLQDFYRGRGYLHAEVRVHVSTNERTQRSVVVYSIRSGPRSRIADVQFRGGTGPFQPPELISRLGLKPGDAYSQRAARDDAERLQTWLIQKGYRTARVDAPAEQLNPEKNAVGLTYPIQVGPLVTLQVIGADEKQLQKRDLLPVLGNQGYDAALILQSTERLQDFYQRDGYYKAKIDWDPPRTEGGVLKLVLRIVPGPKYTLRDVSFSGNKAFGDDRLAPLMATSPRSLLNLGSGRLVDSQLRADLENLRSFYGLQGYARAEVGPPQIAEHGGDLSLVIPVREGPRQQLVSLKLQGVEALDPKALRRQMPLKEGGPFHPFLLDQTLDVLRSAYRDKGYADAQVSARTDWNAGESLADVTIEVFEGEQMVLDRVIVRGNQRTDGEVIRRTLGVRPGQPISETRRLEIERDLYRLGIFSGLQVELSRTGLGSSGEDLIVHVEEGLPRRVSYSLGLEYGSADARQQWRPRGGFSFINNNVGGRAYSLRTDVRVSELDQEIRVLFDQPTIGRLPVPLTDSVFFFNETKDHWNVVRWGGRVEAARSFNDRRMSLAYDYRFVTTTIDPGFGLIDVERRDRPYELSSLISSFLWDRRNDPLLATRGWSSLVQVQYAFPFLSATGDFLKVFLQQTQYLSLGRPGVVALSLRAGGIEPFRHLHNEDPEVPPGLPNRDVFIDERFFAGGATTHRAYGRDDLGVRGETLFARPTAPAQFSPVGGNGLLLLNLEYRFPVAGPVEGVLFYDAGNVWADWRSIDPNAVKSGAGIGVRYLSPIGPFRLDIGWKLDAERGEPRHVISLSFGNPF